VIRSAISPKPKLHRCKVCREQFTKQRMGQVVCGLKCAAARGAQVREQLAKANYKVRKEAIKTRSDWLKEAQQAFNSFVRARDAQLPCISCGRFHQGAYDAGHYRSVGSMPALRFNEDNCHKQCVPCNQHKAGNVVEYRIRLVERIGADRVAFLEGPHEAAKYTIDDAKAIKAHYKAKLKRLQQGNM
jgi:hypothetical protein